MEKDFEIQDFNDYNKPDTFIGSGKDMVLGSIQVVARLESGEDIVFQNNGDERLEPYSMSFINKNGEFEYIEGEDLKEQLPDSKWKICKELLEEAQKTFDEYIKDKSYPLVDEEGNVVEWRSLVDDDEENVTPGMK